MMTVALAPSASAITVDPLKLNVEKPVKKEKPRPKVEVKIPKVIPPVEYVAVPGDTLTKIAETHQTTVQRLWQKNTNLTNPDLLNIGDKLIIPKPEEVLADRPAAAPPLPSSAPAQSHRAAIPGNGYDWGWCTHWAKVMRPDMPNDLGNADMWYTNAAARGYSVGYAPQVGAVAAAVSYMHVAYVKAVDGNRVLVSEMNYNGFGVVSERWSDTSEWRYIY